MQNRIGNIANHSDDCACNSEKSPTENISRLKTSAKLFSSRKISARRLKLEIMIRLLFVSFAFLFIVSSCSSEKKDIIKVENNPPNAVSIQKSSDNVLSRDDEGKNAIVEQAESKSVLDYYLMLPDKYFYRKPDDVKARRSYIKVKDLKNGYLKIEKPYKLNDISKVPKEDLELERAENEVTKARAVMEVALFKRKQGRNIVVVNSHTGGDNPFLVLLKLDFWEDDGGDLKDVTEYHRAKIDNDMAFAEFQKQRKPTDKYPSYLSANDIASDLYPELPRYGKAIKIIINPDSAERRFELLNLVWNGEEFVCEPASKK